MTAHNHLVLGQSCSPTFPSHTYGVLRTILISYLRHTPTHPHTHPHTIPAPPRPLHSAHPIRHPSFVQPYAVSRMSHAPHISSLCAPPLALRALSAQVLSSHQPATPSQPKAPFLPNHLVMASRRLRLLARAPPNHSAAVANYVHRWHCQLSAATLAINVAASQ